jgi:hypothetical protein
VTLSPDEIAGGKLMPTWRTLAKVVAQGEAVDAHLEEVLKGMKFDTDGMTKGLQAMFSFVWAWEVEHGPLPTLWEMVVADRAGRLQEFIAEANAEWDAAVAAHPQQVE